MKAPVKSVDVYELAKPADSGQYSRSALEYILSSGTVYDGYYSSSVETLRKLRSQEPTQLKDPTCNEFVHAMNAVPEIGSLALYGNRIHVSINKGYELQDPDMRTTIHGHVAGLVLQKSPGIDQVDIVPAPWLH